MEISWIIFLNYFIYIKNRVENNMNNTSYYDIQRSVFNLPFTENLAENNLIS
jgi:hypothetical protein